jgi:predicted nucleic acid-binding protein
MGSDAPIVIFDANVLFPFHVGHLLTFMAFKRLVLGRWTDEIQDEWIEHIAEKFPEDLDGCKRRRTAMNRAMPDALVKGYEHRVPKIMFNDPDDRHVIAAALECNAVGIVTRDKDFTDKTLKDFNLSVCRERS